MKNISLVVLAAGMGSRFGGLKQLSGVGPHGETLLEYGVHDACRAGFQKVIFVIQENFEAEFRDVLVSRLAGAIDVVCVRQDMADLPDGRSRPANRIKPWGTGHALLAARSEIEGPFAVINGDDFYGNTSYHHMAEFLGQGERDEGGLRLGLIGYLLKNTLSSEGSVSRGVCEVDDRDYLVSLKEHRDLCWNDTGTAVHSGEQGIELSGEELVSLNLFGLQAGFMDELELGFDEFLAGNGSSLDAEFFLPDTVSRVVRDGKATLRVIATDETWFGMTYAEERENVESAIRERILKGIYPEKLWS